MDREPHGEQRDDLKAIEAAGFPAPPYPIRYSKSPVLIFAGYVAILVLLLGGAAIPIVYFGFSSAGRDLIVDTALAAGVGQPLSNAVIRAHSCNYQAKQAGNKLPGHWRCTVTVTIGGVRTTHVTETISKLDEQPLGAGRVLGATGLYWSAGMVLARWWNASFLMLMSLFLLAIAIAALRAAKRVRRHSRFRRARIRPADLLTWKGRPAFSFVDAHGRRRFARAPDAMAPLIIDGLRTSSATLVAGKNALLLSGNLEPLAFDVARRDYILENIAEERLKRQTRSLLPPQAGDPPTLLGRIEAIEQALAKRSTDLRQLYAQSWRLIWDSNDATIADRALDARDVIAERLGPEATFVALQDCRRSFGMAH